MFFTDLGAHSRSIAVAGIADRLPCEVSDAAGRAGAADGIPFILGDDGSYDADLNRFFRICPTMGVRSLNSLRAYARDLVTWMRFLAECRNGKTVWRADREDVAAYHAARRRAGPRSRITASSWNRSVAALEKFYVWAVEENLIAASPFPHDVAWRRISGTRRYAAMRINRGYEPAARKHDTRFIDLEHFLIFRDTGLAGRQPDGGENGAWRGRHGARNVLFAELLVTTGLRLEEASSLLVAELPRLDGLTADRVRRSVPFKVPASIAKGGKSREIRLPIRLLRRIQDYIEVERANVLARRSLGRQLCRGEPLLAGKYGRGNVIIDGAAKPVRLDLLTPCDRRRLISKNGGEPGGLWLAENGLPMTSAAWEIVFRRASARCQSLGFDLDVTPHALRHTFAVHMLSMLIREQIGSVVHDRSVNAGAAVYRRMIGDPLQKLQRLMGHASITSTHIYLDSLEESRTLVEAAAARWAGELEGSL